MELERTHRARSDESETMSNKPIPVSQWGKDHWSTLGYIETRCMDHRGLSDRAHMRCDTRLHPQFANEVNRALPDKKYPTRLRDGVERGLHDDWSCLDDAEAAGFAENIGTGINRCYRITEHGERICAALRAHKRAGGNWANFVWPPAVTEQLIP